MPPTRCSATPTARRCSRAWWERFLERLRRGLDDQPGNCRAAWPHRGRVRARRAHHGAHAQLDRTRHLLRDVERALLLQIVAEMAEAATDYRPARHLRPGRECRRG